MSFLISLSFRDKTHKLNLPLPEELQPLLEIFIHHFNLFFLIGVLILLFDFLLMHIRLQLEDLILYTSNLILNHLVLSNQVAIHVLLVDALLA